MRPVSATFRQRLKESHRSTSRITVLDPISFSPLAVLSGDAGYAVQGNVSMDRNRKIRRTVSLTVANPDGVWSPAYSQGAGAPAGLFFLNSLLRAERGIYLSGTTVEWCVLGHFLVDRPTVDVDAAGSTIQVQGSDRLKLLERSDWTIPTTYGIGTRISTLVQTEAIAAGMGTWAYRLDDLGKTLVVARTFPESLNRLDGLSALAADYGLELYADADGYLAMGPPPDPNSAATAYTFTSGEDAIHLGITKGWTDDRLYNHVVVTGEAADGTIIRSELWDSNPASPAYRYGPLGDRVYRYTSAMIRTQAMADLVAAQLLPRVALIEEDLKLPTVTVPFLEPGDAVAITEPVSKTDGRYLVDALGVPLRLGTQALSSRVLRSLV